MLDPNSNRDDLDLEGRHAGYTGRGLVQSWLTLLFVLFTAIVVLVLIGLATGRVRL